MIKKTINIIFFALCILLLVVSCKTTRNVGKSTDIKPMQTSKIIKKVEKEAPQYKSFESKKVNINFETNDMKNSLTAQLTIVKNKSILLSAKKLTIPVAKVLLTTDSLKYINYLEKSYASESIVSLKRLIGINADYHLLQAILTADFSEFINNENNLKGLTNVIDQNMFLINKKIKNSLTKENEQKSASISRTNNNNELIDFSAWIDPQLFVVKKVSLNNKNKKESITLNYDQYETIGRNLFPKQISFELKSAEENIKVNISISKPTLNDAKDNKFALPEKYEKQNITNNR